MKQLLTFCILALLSLSSYASDLPKRKSGIWEIKMTVDGKPGMNMKQCIDEKTDNVMQNMGKEAAQQCSKQDIKKVSGGFDIDSVCKFGESTTTTRAQVRGSMDSGYVMDMESTFNPPSYGMSQSKMRIENKYLGACPSGWAAGDIELPGGMKMNLNALSGMAGAPGGKR